MQTPNIDIKEWAALIGSFIINFGGVEMAAFQWITKWSPNPVVDRDSAIDMLLGKRIRFVCQLIERCGLPDERKKKALELWGEVAGLTKTRNIIAHSPFITHTRSGKQEHGFIDVKKMKGPGPYQLEPLTLNDIRNALESLARVIPQIIAPF